MVIDPMYTRLLCTAYYIFACHYMGIFLRVPFKFFSKKLVLAFIYTVPFALIFGINWKILALWGIAYLSAENLKKWAEPAILIFEFVLYFYQTLVWYGYGLGIF